jgi:hypothetical protein
MRHWLGPYKPENSQISIKLVSEMQPKHSNPEQDTNRRFKFQPASGARLFTSLNFSTDVHGSIPWRMAWHGSWMANYAMERQRFVSR